MADRAAKSRRRARRALASPTSAARIDLSRTAYSSRLSNRATSRRRCVFFPRVEKKNLRRAFGASHVGGDLLQGARVLRRLRKHIHPVAQRRAAQAAQVPPDAHAGGGLPGGERDEQSQEVQRVALIQVENVDAITSVFTYISCLSRPPALRATQSPARWRATRNASTAPGRNSTVDTAYGAMNASGAHHLPERARRANFVGKSVRGWRKSVPAKRRAQGPAPSGQG